jgi:16S rRNA C967 or C1407 C5-methylase (RsmB/RsmF family)
MNKIINPEYDILDNVFPDDKNIDKSKLKMTTEGLYSVSGKEGAKFIRNIIYNNMGMNKNITITDGTANNGSDTLMLGKFFKHVNAIELDKTNYEVLKHNISIYGYTNINLINGNTIEKLNDLVQDVILIDAPWGGKSYFKNPQLKLYLDNLELSDIYNQFKKKTKLFVVKVPFNYNINNLISSTLIDNIQIYSYKKDQRIKFLIIVIKIN